MIIIKKEQSLITSILRKNSTTTLRQKKYAKNVRNRRLNKRNPKKTKKHEKCETDSTLSIGKTNKQFTLRSINKFQKFKNLQKSKDRPGPIIILLKISWESNRRRGIRWGDSTAVWNS